MPNLLSEILICIGVVALLLLLWARFIEPRWLIHEQVEVFLPDLPPALEGFRISLLSDLHYPRYSDRRLIHRAIDLSNAALPDIVLITGDICDRERWEKRVAPFLGDVLAGIENRYGIYGVLGNHDHWLSAEAMREELARSTSVQLVENSAVILDIQGTPLAIAGVGDFWAGETDIAAALSQIVDSIPRILLSHNPDVAEQASAGFRVDLQVSGHTHGGQVRIPFGPAPRVPSKFGNKYRAGLVQGPNYPVYINRGICSMYNIRFWCRPEVTLLILRREERKQRSGESSA